MSFSYWKPLSNHGQHLKESQNSLTFSRALAFAHVVNQVNESQISNAIQHEIPSLIDPYRSAFGTVDEPPTCAFETQTLNLHRTQPPHAPSCYPLLGTPELC